MQEKKLVFQEPVFIHSAAIRCPHEEVCAWPPPSPGAGNSAPWGTDPTRWAVCRLQEAGTLLFPTWLLAAPETCPGVTPRRGGRSFPQRDPALATVLPGEQFLGLSRRQAGRVAGAGWWLASTPAAGPPLKSGRPQQVWGRRGNLQQ